MYLPKILLALTLLLYPISALFAEGSPNESQKRINLGLIVPLTGSLGFFGRDYVRTYEIAVEDFPEMKDLINPLWEDSAYDSKQAVTVFNKLNSIENVDIVLSFGGPMLNALAPLAESKKIPFFATESEKSDCEGRKFCSLFRNEEDEWGKATWRVLRKEGRKNIGIVKNQNQFMNTFVNAIIRNKNEDEKAEVLIDVPPDTVDLRSNVLGLKYKDFDALGVYLLPGSHRGLLAALHALNKPVHLFGVEEFLVKESNQGHENLVEGALVIAPGAIPDYRSKFEKKHGYSAGFFYTPAFYDFLILLKDTIQKNPELRGEDLVNAMHFTGERSGVSGKYRVKKSDDGVFSYSFPIYIYKVSGQTVLTEEVINF